MPVCPNCLYEYLEGKEICPDCGVKLVPGLSDALTDFDDYELLYTCDKRYEAEMIKANLESADIPCFVLEQKDRVFPAVGDLAVIKIYVRKDNLDEAKSYLADYLNQKDAGEDE